MQSKIGHALAKKIKQANGNFEKLKDLIELNKELGYILELEQNKLLSKSYPR